MTRVKLPPPWAMHPDALDETVVHDPGGRPWLVCTTDRLYEPRRQGRRDRADSGPEADDGLAESELAGAAMAAGRYETQIFYTARAGIRGFPTGHGERFSSRDEALTGHRCWCLRVRTGEVEPDRVPEEPLDGLPG